MEGNILRSFHWRSGAEQLLPTRRERVREVTPLRTTLLVKLRSMGLDGRVGGLSHEYGPTVMLERMEVKESPWPRNLAHVHAAHRCGRVPHHARGPRRARRGSARYDAHRGAREYASEPPVHDD